MADLKTTLGNARNFAEEALRSNAPTSARVADYLYRLSKTSPERARAALDSMGRSTVSAAKSALSPITDPVVNALNYINSESPSRAVKEEPWPGYIKEEPWPSGGAEVITAPSRGNAAASPVSQPQASTIYQNASGEQIAPQSGGNFMSRRGAFTGPNNDPNTPGMTREYATEPALTAFNPDDARYAKRQADIAARESQAQIDLRRAIAEREDRESRAKIGNTAEDRKIAAEDRQRRIEQEDRMEAFKADQQRLMIENQRAEMERRAVWSQQHGGIPWSPQAEAEQIKKDENRSIADTHEMSVRELNAQEQMLDSDLDIIAQGGAPMNPELIAAITQMTGKPFGSVPLGKPEVEQIRAALKATIQRERDMADDRMRSLLGQIRITRTEKQSEFDQ